MKSFRVALTLFAIVTSVATSASELRSTLELSALRVEVTWVESAAEMNALRRQYGQPPIDTVIRTRLTGFSVLGRRDGEYVCLLFVQRPRRVDDERTTALGHEMLHCLTGEFH